MVQHSHFSQRDFNGTILICLFLFFGLVDVPSAYGDIPYLHIYLTVASDYDAWGNREIEKKNFTTITQPTQALKKTINKIRIIRKRKVHNTKKQIIFV